MPPRHILALCYAASGAAALVYQVAWVRLFTLTLGHTIAASSTVLAAFMGGLAVGAWAAGRRPPAHSRTLATYAALELLIAAAAIAIPSLLSALDPLLVWAYADGTVPMRFALVRVAVSLMLLGIPAAAMGATYPIAVSWLAHSGDLEHEDRRRAATQGGVLYAVNTAGAAAGAIAAGFWLIPSLGIRGTTWIAVALNIAAAGGALWLVRAGSPAPLRALDAATHPASGAGVQDDRRAAPHACRGCRRGLGSRGPGVRSRMDATARAGRRTNDVCLRHHGRVIHYGHCRRIDPRRPPGTAQRQSPSVARGHASGHGHQQRSGRLVHRISSAASSSPARQPPRPRSNPCFCAKRWP